MEALAAAGTIAVVMVLLYLKVRGLVAYLRELKRNRHERLLLCAALAGLPLTIGSCVLIERMTGVSPDGAPPSFVVRQTVGVFFLVGYGVAVWRLTVYPEAKERSRLVVSRQVV